MHDATRREKENPQRRAVRVRLIDVVVALGQRHVTRTHEKTTTHASGAV
jgi:hypothetical protein